VTQADAEPSHPSVGGPEFARGAAYGTAAVSIWAGWIVVTRLGVTRSLASVDIAALRFGVAGLILLPVLWRRGLALDRLGWLGLATLALGGGAPFVLLVGAGLHFAPAAHAGALFPGVMPLFVALLASSILGESFPWMKRVGLVLILSGALAIVGFAGLSRGGSQGVGHFLFLGAALLWASHTVSMRRARLDGLHAAAIAAVVSMIFYLPIYAVVAGARLLDVPIGDIVFQGLYQGVITMVISLFLYGRAISLLGASSGAAFGALGPAMAALIAIPALGEWPTRADWIAIMLISAGVYLAGGGPLPWPGRPTSDEGRRSATVTARDPARSSTTGLEPVPHACRRRKVRIPRCGCVRPAARIGSPVLPHTPFSRPSPPRYAAGAFTGDGSASAASISSKERPLVSKPMNQ